MKKELMTKTLFELMKNSRRSDRALARNLGLWHSTITRWRKKLEKEGIIREYTLVPDFAKMGYEILTFQIVTKMEDIPSEIWSEKMRELLNDFPQVIFSTVVAGEAFNALITSLHRNYTALHKYLNRFLKASKGLLADYPGSNIVLLTSLVEEHTLKSFSLGSLEEDFILP